MHHFNQLFDNVLTCTQGSDWWGYLPYDKEKDDDLEDIDKFFDDDEHFGGRSGRDNWHQIEFQRWVVMLLQKGPQPVLPLTV